MTKPKMLKGGSLSPDTIQALLKKSYEKKLSSFKDFEIDKSLSGQRVQVYYNPALNQAVVVHRGSSGAKDWLVNDAGLLVGYRGKRFSHAQDIQKQAQKKYGAKNVTTIGHSLGAKIAEEVGQKSKEIITLNKPTVDTKKVSDKQFDIRASSDLVSGLSGIASSNDKTTIPSGFRNPISEHSIDVLSRLPNKPIGKGRRKGGKKAVEKPVRGRDPATISLMEIDREELAAQMREAQRAAVAQQMIDDAEMARWFPNLTLAPIQNPDEMIRPIRQRNIGVPRGGIRRSAVTPAQMFQLIINRYEAIQDIEDERERHDQLDRLLQEFTTYIVSLPDNEPLLNDFNVLLDIITDEFIELGEEIDQLQGGVREGAIAPVNTPDGLPITFEMDSQRRLQRIYTTIEKRLEIVINDSNNGMDYDEAIGKLHDLYRAAKKYNFQDLISEIEHIGNQIEESEILRQREEAYRIQEEDDDAREDRIARAMNRTEKYPPRPYKTPLQPPPKRGGADAQTSDLREEGRDEEFRAFIRERVATTLGAQASNKAKIDALRYLLTELAATGPADMELFERNFPAEMTLIRKSIETLLKDSERLKPAPAARLTPENVIAKFEIISNIPSGNPTKLVLLDKLIKETGDFVGKLSAADQALYNPIIQSMINKSGDLTGAGVEGGARYRYQPATGQYKRLYSPFATKFANDIVIRQYDIDDLYTQILLNPPDRGPEIMAHFKNDKNLNDDQLDYILSVIDSNKTRKEFYKGIQTPYTGNVDERGPLAVEYPDAPNPIGSRSRFVPEQNIPTAEENQEEIPVAQFVPRTGNEGINPFGYDDEGELIPPNPTGAGRIDGYNQCHDCGCDSYRDFNALHELEGGGPVFGRPARIAPDPLENALADRARVLADIAPLREQVFQRRVRVAEIEEQRAQEARERNQYLARLADLRNLRDNTRNLFNIVNSGVRDQATVGMYNVTWTRYMRLRDELGQDDNPEFPTNFG